MAKSIIPETRDEFPPNVIEILKKRAAFICSNPSCKVMTVAPSIEDENKVQYIGVASHITAAKLGGPRYDSLITPEERKAISNAIFLCNNCGTMIDKNNGLDYKVKTLNKWKSDHEKWVLNNLNKSAPGISPISVITSSENQSGGITANVVNLNGINFNPIDDKKEHDKKIFIEADKIFNEDNLNKILDSMLGDESIWSYDQDKLEYLKIFFEKSSNDFINEEIDNNKNELLKSLKKLIVFLGKEFDMFPYKQPMTKGFRACLQPTLNVDRLGTGGAEEHANHMKLHTQLRDVCHQFEENFKKYRKSIKSNLYI
jgi:hypothetical protein